MQWAYAIGNCIPKCVKLVVSEKMNNREKTFGQFLRGILEKRNLSIRRLSALMEMKSKTQLQRIADDESSYRSIVRFAEKFEKTVELSDSEKKEMSAAIELHRIPSDTRAVRKALRSLISNGEGEEKVCRCTFLNGEECREKVYLEELIMSAAGTPESGDVSVYIENITSPELINVLKKLAHRENRPRLVIYHFFRNTSDKKELGMQLVALFKLAPYADYYPYSLPKNLVKSRRIIIFCKGSGKTHFFNFYTQSGFGYLCENTSLSVQKHLLAEYSNMIEKSLFMTKERFDTPLECLPDFIEEQQKVDDLSAVAIESAPCFMIIPFHIQKRLYEDTNYLGYGKDDPTIQRMYKVLKARSERLHTVGIDRQSVCDTDCIQRFLESGKTDDYFPQFRPLTRNEAVETLESMLRIKGFRIYLLKDGYSCRDLMLASYESRFISAINPKGGYWKNYSQINITDREMAQMLESFITDDVIPNCCHSEEDSRRIIEELIERAKGG